MSSSASLSDTIGNAAQVLSVLLVFSGIGFSLLYDEATQLLNQEPPPGSRERLDVRSGILRFARTKWLFLMLSNLGFAYLLTPPSIKIQRECRLNLWDFDLVLTLFVLLCLAEWVMTLWSVVVAARLLHRARTLT